MNRGNGGRSRSPRPLTARQREALDFITDWIENRGYPPTLREICYRFSMRSTNAARSLLTALEAKGVLHRRRFQSRGIELPTLRGRRQHTVRIPIVGRVAAGTPLLAEQNVEGELVLDRNLFPSGDGFALRVKGDSMVDDGIRDGDIVLARPDMPVSSGNIVVALIREEATVKRYFPEDGGVRLQPSNPAYEPLFVEVDSDEFRIVGKVVGLFRRY